ncbi:OHCU decarboxylase [Bacterioplanes sanyensis]|uniref:2-oxo-4-hydroxy-4-carboxy-5-ureidoimidazoline decarboxylase n=1 Tax=Bacterioplanes sanyensis TaxID=1249553 RepID=A0A222FFK5_9GAMM|nr:2-oxo-4-hydroxy-4-carboxy-5-ureidoimidazoline decarboxylase [Bacterioplanes sanyensis]ASP37356.1 OHCU decarboxylase [Bacterioplanes sanyensis]
MMLTELNQLSEQHAQQQLSSCCAAERWVEGMVSLRPFESVEQLCQQADIVWQQLSEADYLQAFEAHPKIGDVSSLREKYANTKAIAANEQSGAQHAAEATLQRLAQLNQDYQDKFGFIFIVFATGKSAEQMLELLEQRIHNSREQEIANAAANQMQITNLRLQKLLEVVK